MPTPNFILLFVDDCARSAAFYAPLLGTEPVETSPTFVLFGLPSGLKIGLWSHHTAEPAPTAPGGGSEVGFPLASAGEVDRLHADWLGRGLPILQPPTDMDFGRTFVAVDPDGHRLRVFCPAD